MDNTPKPWTGYASRAGAASVVTMYLEKVPEGNTLDLDYIAANVYTTVHGDYSTAKYVNLGIERGGRKFYLKCSDIGTSNVVISDKSKITLYPGDRIFAELEAIATTETYELCAFGTLCPM